MSQNGGAYIINPLRDKECECIDCVLSTVPGLEATMAAAERCGLDMSAQKERVTAQRHFASKVKQEFIPFVEGQEGA